jgi:hypothetical protein
MAAVSRLCVNNKQLEMTRLDFYTMQHHFVLLTNTLLLMHAGHGLLIDDYSLDSITAKA